MSAPHVSLWLSCGAIPADVLGLAGYARARRGASAWWDVLVVALALYFALLAVVGWARLVTGALR